MNNTHTPGPWQVSPYGNITSKSGKIASVEQMPGNYESEKQANARLISSAPDLFSALEKLSDYVFEFEGKQNICTSVWMDARAAIAKAKGEA
jgi:hypothetical protein